ncbi:uncharacterized protein LOC143036836 [Oratosquilla oratoria]|uniref:uncharacterized protein LOC143036836 n=1 Tax=Oratosquilla oratoria TaxID=337810 RepID=UPI003F75C001
MNATAVYNNSLFGEYAEEDRGAFLDIFNGSFYDQFDNQSKIEEDSVPYTYRPETYIIPAVFFLIFVTGAVGNGALIFMFARYRQLRGRSGGLAEFMKRPCCGCGVSRGTLLTRGCGQDAEMTRHPGGAKIRGREESERKWNI